MKTEYRPIAMRCTQEQFDSIKDRITLPIVDIGDFFELPFLVFNYSKITSGFISNNRHPFTQNTEVHETFDGELFLDCCGGEKKDEINVPADVKEYLKDKVWKGSEIQILHPEDPTLWINANQRLKYRIKPQPDYTAEIEALAKKAKENGQKVIIKIELCDRDKIKIDPKKVIKTQPIIIKENFKK
jgi:hypothetical protein